MKNRLLIILAVLAVAAALFALGCKKEESSTSDTSETVATATSSTDTVATDTAATTSTTDTSGTSATSTATTSSMSSTPLSDDDKKFVEKAAAGGMAEVSLGSSVSPKATNPDVKAFADRMVTDHTKANDQLKQLATAKGVTLPAETDEAHKKAADKVLASKNVDKAYMDDMVRDHDQDVKEFEEASKKVKDADLKAWVDATLPVLKDHQKMAKETQKKVK